MVGTCTCPKTWGIVDNTPFWGISGRLLSSTPIPKEVYYFFCALAEKASKKKKWSRAVNSLLEINQAIRQDLIPFSASESLSLLLWRILEWTLGYCLYR